MRKFLFADESGCMAFNKGPNISKYFILCTVHIEPEAIENKILRLRRSLPGLATTRMTASMRHLTLTPLGTQCSTSSHSKTFELTPQS